MVGVGINMEDVSPLAILKCGKNVLAFLRNREVLRLLQRVDGRLDKSLIQSALTAFRHLSDAATCADEGVMRTELETARRAFAKLCDLDPHDDLSVKRFWIFRKTVKQRSLVCAGYYGSFCYFEVDPILWTVVRLG